VIDQQRSSLSLRNGYLAERGMIWMNSTKKSVLYTAHTGRSKLQHKRDDADSFPVHPTNGRVHRHRGLHASDNLTAPA
jgi:hypothetical protein